MYDADIVNGNLCSSVHGLFAISCMEMCKLIEVVTGDLLKKDTNFSKDYIVDYFWQTSVRRSVGSITRISGLSVSARMLFMYSM